MTYWGNNPYWSRLSSADKAAAMALLEADSRGGKIDVGAAKDALGAMINRAARDGVDIGDHVSGRIYQPTIEPSQFARLGKIVGSPEHQQLVQAYNDRVSGKTPDWVNGATHFLAPERTMLSLEAQDPRKYHSWRSWTGYDDATGQYKGVLMRDGSHAFLAPEGAYSAVFDGSGAVTGAAPTTQVASVPPMPAEASPSPTPAGGMLSMASLGSGDGSSGLLGSFFGKGGMLDTFGAAMTKAPAQSSSKPQDTQDAPMPQMQAPRPVDLSKLRAMLAARQKLGTSGMEA